MKTLYTLIFICFAYVANGQLCDPNTNSLYFNGTDAFVEIGPGTDLNITDDITVEAWINASSWGSSPVSNSIVCKHGWSAGERGYVLRAGGNGQLSFTIAGVNNSGNNVSWKEVVSPDNALQLNTWHHVAGTYNGDKLRIYIDGVQAGSVNFKGSIDPSVNYKMKIGRIADDNTADKRFFHGIIDEVRIWDDVLSANDINSSRNSHIDPSAVSHLVGYWRMNEGVGNSVLDLGTGINPGIWNNTGWNTDVPFTNGIQRPVINQIGSSLNSNSSVGNQWNYFGVPVFGAIHDQLTPLQSGDYSVTVDSGSGCTATSLNYTFLFTGIGENNLQAFIKYFQSENIIYFDADPSITLTTQMKVTDINGRILNEYNTIPGQLDLQSLAKGIYILSFQSSNGYLTSKIVLQ